MFKKFGNWVKTLYCETLQTVREVPTVAVVFFVLSIVLMNQLAAYPLVETSWLCLDAGIFVAWFSFLAMDVVVKTFGPKKTNRLVLFGLVVNLFCCVVLMIPSIIDCVKANDFSLDSFIAPFWVLGASSVAFLISGVINTFVNHLIGVKMKEQNEKKAFIVRTYISTTIGQFLDNLVFAMLFTFPASLIGVWGAGPQTILAIVGFAAVGALVELVCEIIFSPLGYNISRKWIADGIGTDFVKQEHN